MNNFPNNPAESTGVKCKTARQNRHSVLDLRADTHSQHSGLMAFCLLLYFFVLLNLGCIIQKTKKDLAAASAFPVFVDPVQNKEQIRGKTRIKIKQGNH